MSRAGDRHKNLTGNIWSYANRGDLTGIKAALARGVDVDIQNTVGWTPLHAAAAGGHPRALRLLVRSGAELCLRDRGGNCAVHEAAKNGHNRALQTLRDLGADLSVVRLSQARGQACRLLVAEATRKAGEDVVESVGYGRKQAKSNAFYGPRKTPISGKIKRKILKEKRCARRQAKDAEERVASEGTESGHGVGCLPHPTAEDMPSYASTVQEVKRSSRRSRRQRSLRSNTAAQRADCSVVHRQAGSPAGETRSSSESDGDYTHHTQDTGFAALAVSDSESESSATDG